MHISNASLEIRVKDIQNSPPVFQGSLAAIIDEDSPIGTLVMTVVARDGDRGQPRKIIYDLISSKCFINYVIFYSIQHIWYSLIAWNFIYIYIFSLFYDTD